MKILIFYFGLFTLLQLNRQSDAYKPDEEMIWKLSTVTNLTSFCKFMSMDNCESTLNKSVPTYDGKVVVSGTEDTQIALFDACNPREQTIALPRHPDPDITVWPTCTRAMRCGGCCTSDVFSCEPTEQKEKFVKVFDTRLPYPGAQRFTFLGVRVVKITEDVLCDAQCKTKAHECKPLQIYEARKCRCVCRPERLILKSTCNDAQIWDDTECDCICPNRNTASCPEPSFFSKTTCKCSLKTGVSGEIDIGKFFEQLDKNRIENPDIILKPDKGHNLSEKGVFGNETLNITEEQALPVSKIQELTETTKLLKKGEPTESTTLTKTKKMEELTKTTTTPTTTSTSTSTKTTPTTTPNKCAQKICHGSWTPKVLSNGICQCTPPIG